MRVLFVVSALFALGAVAQSRVDAFTPANVTVTTTQLEQLPDGGCAAQWCGEISSDDAGTRLRACTDLVELRMPTNRARCDALVTAGGARVLRELRFAVDGGAP